MTDTVYEFLYSDCIYESAMATISLHKTKKGAYKAMNKHLNDLFNKKRNERLQCGTNQFINSIYDHVFEHCGYRIAAIEVYE